MKTTNPFLAAIAISTTVFLFGIEAKSKEVSYHLHVETKSVNITGKTIDHAMALRLDGAPDSTIPAPTLNFTIGDQATITVTNHTKEPTSLHWHGLLVPWNMDGPMFSNNKPIAPGESFTFRFPIKQSGTYWYHSHTGLQEQRGVYGAIVVNGLHDHHMNQFDHDIPVVLSDWTDEKPMDVLANLKKDGDWYKFKKKSFPSIIGAIRHGAIWDYIKSDWTRMGPMDLSDIGYDAFLINGKESQQNHSIKPGDRVRLRIINAGASTYFYVNLGNLRSFHVISKDGVDVEHIKINELLLGMGETYDIAYTVPSDDHKQIELRATSQDVTGFASYFIGHGSHIEKVPNKIRPNPYKMGDHGGHSGGGDHGGGGADDEPRDDDDHDNNHGNESGDSHTGHEGHGLFSNEMSDSEMDSMPMSQRLDISQLRAKESTEFDASLNRHVINLSLDGDMERYTWTINGKMFSEDTYIEIKEGEVVQFTMENKTMMHHPMHLHGHFFRVLNGQGERSPLFHTIDVGPMQTKTIEFLANEPGIWFFHCHNLYHMEMGMARWIKYEGFERPKELIDSQESYKDKFVKDTDFFPHGDFGVGNNRATLNIGVNGGKYEAEVRLELDHYDPDTFEAEAMFHRYLSRYMSVFTGVEYKDKKIQALVGAAYELPFRVHVTGYLTTDGKAVVTLKKSFPIYKRLEFDTGAEVRIDLATGDAEWELENELKYRMRNNLDLVLFHKYDEDDKHWFGVMVSVKF